MSYTARATKAIAHLFRLTLVGVALASVAGCSEKAPTDQATEQQQLQELNDARQREWGNK
jgi:outer membrane murein-binding lipoprotein Lpp